MQPSNIKQQLQQIIFAHKYTQTFNSYSRSVFLKLANCHTLNIGVHQYRCNNNNCSHTHYQYHSCGNRHCPNCGTSKKEQWIIQRMDELLPTTYYHLVFTIPSELHAVVLGNRKVCLNILFKAAHYTINKLAANKKYLGAKPGILSVLHTWGQQLSFHPHVHCVVSGGGINSKNKWVKEKRKQGNFLFPTQALSTIYKAVFLKLLNKAYQANKIQLLPTQNFSNILIQATTKHWLVYAKAPFAGPEKVINYLGRYTHKTAITTNRITNITAKLLSFTYKDYRDNNKQKLLTLSHEEFLRRFEQHILPAHFVRIRHGGYLAHNGKNKRLKKITKQL